MSDDFLRNSEQKITMRSMDECRNWLFQHYGTDYNIRNKRVVLKGGFLGLGQHECIEVTYVVGQPKKPSFSQEPLSTGEDFHESRNELLKNAGVTNTLQIAQLDKNVTEKLAELAGKIDQISQATHADEKHPSIQKVEELLRNNDFTLSYINKISNRLRSEFSLQELDDFAMVQKTVVKWIGESISILPRNFYKSPHIIVLVGPTGVGKTTTVAKIAAQFILKARESGKPRPNLRLVTIDRTRVGAESNLRTYGDIMNIPVDKAENADDLKKIFEDYKDSLDALIIDSSGYSPNDYENIAKMRTILNVHGLNPDVYLTVSASTTAKGLSVTFQNFESFNYDSVIVTKCDETTAIGNVISVLAEKNKKVSYITNGQQVPRYIQRATVNEFLKLLTEFEFDRSYLDDTFPQEDI